MRKKSNLIQRKVCAEQLREKLNDPKTNLNALVRKSGVCHRTLYNILDRAKLPELATLEMLERFL